MNAQQKNHIRNELCKAIYKVVEKETENGNLDQYRTDSLTVLMAEQCMVVLEIHADMYDYLKKCGEIS